MNNPLLALGTLALLLIPLVSADEQPNAYADEEHPGVQEASGVFPPCTPLFIYTNPPDVGINEGCIQDTIDDLPPLPYP